MGVGGGKKIRCTPKSTVLICYFSTCIVLYTSMSVKAGINVVFKRRLPKYVEYAAVCGFGSPHSQKREWKKILFLGGLGKLESAGP